jgi:hemerythrin superfamily protein
MKSEEIYDAWKERKSQIDLRENFADEVMSRIYQYERDKGKPLFDVQRLIELISAHRYVKAGVVTASVVAGLARIMFVVYNFLAC